MRNALFRKGLVCGIILLFVGTSIIPVNNANSEIKNTSEQKGKSTTDWWPMYQHDTNHSGYSTCEAPDSNNTRWIYTQLQGQCSAVIIVDGKAYFECMSDMKFYCLDAYSGNFIWNYETGDALGTYGSPSFENGKVYFGGLDHNIYCLNATNGNPIWIYPAGRDFWWSPAVYNNKLYIGTFDVQSPHEFFCLNANTGGSIWTKNFIGEILSPAIANGNVYICEGLYNYYTKIYCLNAETGQTIWNYPVQFENFYQVSVVENRVYAGTNDGHLYCLGSTAGDFLWRYTANGAIGGAPAVYNGRIYFGCEDSYVYCLNALTGNFIWKFYTGIINLGDDAPAVADGKVYIGGYPYLYCLDAETGTEIWSYPVSANAARSFAILNGLLYWGGDSKIYCFGSSKNQPPVFESPTPVNESTNNPLSFSWSIPINDPEGDTFSWAIQCSNGQTNSATGATNGTKTLVLSGLGYLTTYKVWVNATDSDGSGFYTRRWYIFTTRSNQPPGTPIITGPSKGKIKVATDYTFKTIDPDGNDVYYFIDWGDQTNSNWIGPYPSGDIIKKSHTWSKKGTYTIKAKAKDSSGAEGGWGTLTVTMPCSYNIPMQWFLERLFEQFPNAFPIQRHMMGY